MPADKKQTILIILTVIAFLFLGYEIFRLVSDDKTPRSNATAQVAAIASPTTASAATSQSKSPAPAAAKDNAAPVLANLNQSPLVKDQRAYLQLVNEYQLAKMRHQLVDEQAAIAEAQQRITQLQGSAPASNNVFASASSDQNQGIQLSYLDKQNGQWSATINQNGQYVQVSAGTTLAKNIKVLAVDNQGVLIAGPNQVREKITFNGIEPAPVIAKHDKKPAPKLKVAKHDKAAVETGLPRDVVTHNDKKYPILSKELQATLPKHVAHEPAAHHAKKSTAVITKSRKLVLPHYTVTKLPPRILHYNTDEKSVLAMHSKNYMIQLISSDHQKTVKDFSAQQMLGYKTYIVRINHKGKLWYSLLFGNYKTQKAAQAAISRMPPHLKVEGPWIKQVSVIQQQLKARKAS